MHEQDAVDDRPDAEFATWHVYDAGGPMLRLKVRFLDGIEAPDWEDGLDLCDVLHEAAARGWQAYDREPGNAPGEYVIYHLKRDAESLV